MHERSGTVAPTEPTTAMRQKYQWGES
jgi:hypothetical protein